MNTHSDDAGTPGFGNGASAFVPRPAIVLGLGGTGNQVVRRLKAIFQRELAPDSSDTVQCLVLDVDQRTYSNEDWADLAPLSKNEMFPLYSEYGTFRDVRDNLSAYPEIEEWLLPEVDVERLDRREGAAQIRMLGRVALYRSFGQFVERMADIFDTSRTSGGRLRGAAARAAGVPTDPVVFVVSSLGGGQGTGCFLDIAVALRRIAADRGLAGLNVVGLLTLPSVHEKRVPKDNLPRLYANTHAAMKELDYLMHTVPASAMRFSFPEIEGVVTPTAPAFDMCYLLDNRNAVPVIASDTQMYEQMATQLFLEIATPFGAANSAVRINLSALDGTEKDKLYGTGRRFSSFANYGVSANMRSVVELAAIRSAAALVDALRGPSPGLVESRDGADAFIRRHAIDEGTSDELVDALVPKAALKPLLISEDWKSKASNHEDFLSRFARREDEFSRRQLPEVRRRAEAAAGAKLGGADASAAPDAGILDDLDAVVDRMAGEGGIRPALAFAETLLDAVRTFATAMRDEGADHLQRATDAENDARKAREGLRAACDEISALAATDTREAYSATLWERLKVFNPVGQPKAETGKKSLAHELREKANGQRDELISCFNDVVKNRHAAISRGAAENVFSALRERLELVKSRLDAVDGDLRKLAESLDERRRAQVSALRQGFAASSTMERDLTDVFLDQYLGVLTDDGLVAAARDEMFAGLSKLAAVADRVADADEVGPAFVARFVDAYQQRLASPGAGRETSLVSLLGGTRAQNGRSALDECLDEALHTCRPFLEVESVAGQVPPEFLLIGCRGGRDEIEAFLTDYTATLKFRPTWQVVAFDRPSAIVISRIVHGVAYYWHRQDLIYQKEYAKDPDNSQLPVHLNPKWVDLPEPVPDFSKHDRRVFALALAYERIAVRGSAYFLDAQLEHSLADTDRHATPDWKAIPLMRDPASSRSRSDPPESALIDDDDRTEAMEKFFDDAGRVESVRTELDRYLRSAGLDQFCTEVEAYCSQVLKSAIEKTPDDAGARLKRQLRLELDTLRDVVSELRASRGLKLRR